MSYITLEKYFMQITINSFSPIIQMVTFSTLFYTLVFRRTFYTVHTGLPLFLTITSPCLLTFSFPFFCYYVPGGKNLSFGEFLKFLNPTRSKDCTWMLTDDELLFRGYHNFYYLQQYVRMLISLVLCQQSNQTFFWSSLGVSCAPLKIYTFKS